ncbi:hypothetical protein B0H12DRAFT_1172651, partial [Mycena haematopus]
RPRVRFSQLLDLILENSSDGTHHLLQHTILAAPPPLEPTVAPTTREPPSYPHHHRSPDSTSQVRRDLPPTRGPHPHSSTCGRTSHLVPAITSMSLVAQDERVRVTVS